MYTYSVSGYDVNNKKFSPCSLRFIRKVKKTPHSPFRNYLTCVLPWAAVVAQRQSTGLFDKTLEVAGLKPAGCWAFFFHFYPSVGCHFLVPQRGQLITLIIFLHKNLCLAMQLGAKQAKYAQIWQNYYFCPFQLLSEGYFVSFCQFGPALGYFYSKPLP